MFNPYEIIFAPSSECNLACAHCRVTRSGSVLSADDAIGFLRSAQGKGIEKVGFSGGEPFLALDFLCELSKAAVELDYLFDRVMTNGVWWKNQAELEEKLTLLYDAGFDGIIGISMDSYHGQNPETIASFIQTVFRVWGRRDICQLVWVASKDDSSLFDDFARLTSSLGASLLFEDGFPVEITDDGPVDLSGYDDPEALSIPFYRIPLSPSSGDPSAWNAKKWFRDDFCEGPGNVLYVHPDGRIAVCCGFANEHEQLIAGRLGESDFDTVLKNARGNDFVSLCYDKGLGSERKRLEKVKHVFPGKTDDPCVFCDYLCRMKK